MPEWLGNLINAKIKFSICEVIFGIMETIHNSSNDHMINFLILLGKWYLNKQKSCKSDIIFTEFVQVIRDKLNAVRLTHVMNDTLNDFMNRYGILYTTE